MSDSKTPTEPVEVPSPETSVDSATVEEPKPSSAKKAGAKPTKRSIAPGAVVGGGPTDPVQYSKARIPGPTEGRKSLTVLHLQRRLAEEGFSEAASAPGGRYEVLTQSAVSKYQESLGAEVTGVLTREQFADLFDGDPNVTVSIDTHADHV